MGFYLNHLQTYEYLFNKLCLNFSDYLYTPDANRLLCIIVFEISFVLLDICSLPAKPGQCTGNTNKWYYDKIAGLCKTFVYGGCEGNANSFDSEAQCEQVCTLVMARERQRTRGRRKGTRLI